MACESTEIWRTLPHRFQQLSSISSNCTQHVRVHVCGINESLLQLSTCSALNKQRKEEEEEEAQRSWAHADHALVNRWDVVPRSNAHFVSKARQGRFPSEDSGLVQMCCNHSNKSLKTGMGKDCDAFESAKAFRRTVLQIESKGQDALPSTMSSWKSFIKNRAQYGSNKNKSKNNNHSDNDSKDKNKEAHGLGYPNIAQGPCDCMLPCQLSYTSSKCLKYWKGPQVYSSFLLCYLAILCHCQIFLVTTSASQAPKAKWLPHDEALLSIVFRRSLLGNGATETLYQCLPWKVPHWTWIFP